MDRTNLLRHPKSTGEFLRRVFGPMVAMMMFLVLVAFSETTGTESESVSQPEGYISDEEARLTLARVLSYRAHTLDEAKREYERILMENPDHVDAGIELADVLIRLKHPVAARMQLQKILSHHPNHTGILKTLAELEASLGHARESRSNFEKAIALEPDNDALQRSYAQAMHLWGDFHRIERIYRNLLQHAPQDTDLLPKLAEVLVSSQRYEEAEGIYEQLKLAGLDHRRFCLEMARLHQQKKDFAKALEFLACARSTPPEPALARDERPSGIFADASENDVTRALEMEVDILTRLNRREEAERSIDRLIRNPDTELIGWTAAAKHHRRIALFDERMWQKAQTAAAKAIELAVQRDPELAEALLTQDPLARGHLPRSLIPMRYTQFGKRVFEEAFLEKILHAPGMDALDRCAWAEQYTEDGRPDIASRLYAKAVEIDPACFPARLGLGETFAFDHRYEDALRVLGPLSQEDPEHGKVWITYARVLSWNKQYEKAIDTYDRLHTVYPTDVTPVRESARVAVWAKRMDEAIERYRSLMRPAVDDLLNQALMQGASPAAHRLSEALFGFGKAAEPPYGYTAYEAFLERMSHETELSSDETLQRIRIALLPRYRIQKWADLESTAKTDAWNKHFLAAKDAYARLIAFDPGNAEALFDDAQVKCSLGLCDEEAPPYEALLRMDPTHVQAKRGLERNEIRSRPKLGIDGRIWTEKGRGELSNIVIRQIRIVADMPLRNDRYAVSAGIDSWVEHPKTVDQHSDALGTTIMGRGVLLPSLSGNLRWTHKTYQDEGLGSADLWDASLRWKIRDWLRADLGYERAEEITNAFSLQQQPLADHWKVGLYSQLTRKLDAGIKAEYLDYSDDNSGKLLSGAVGYAFTDHPKIFKITLTETWRDTDEPNRFLYEGERLIDIVHPYWTPRSLTESAITLEWNHDLAEELFCGAPEHVYDVRLSFGTDTEDNAMIRLEADWKVELADHWLLMLRGLIHESRQWDANGIWAEIRYRF